MIRWSYGRKKGEMSDQRRGGPKEPNILSVSSRRVLCEGMLPAKRLGSSDLKGLRFFVISRIEYFRTLRGILLVSARKSPSWDYVWGLSDAVCVDNVGK